MLITGLGFNADKKTRGERVPNILRGVEFNLWPRTDPCNPSESLAVLLSGLFHA